jgi:guanine deaminase
MASAFVMKKSVKKAAMKAKKAAPRKAPVKAKAKAKSAMKKAPASKAPPAVVWKNVPLAKAVSTSAPPEKTAAIATSFMQAAACSALAGVRLEHGGPFGCSIVRDGVIVSCAHNMVLHCKDPTRHAEMNAIKQACEALGTHDLSDCDLYTTCEPCPMCWGAVQWARLGKVHIGVDRHTAAKYGFDDKVFYDEVDDKAGCYGISRCGFITDTTSGAEKGQVRVKKNMVEVYDGLLQDEVMELFTNPAVNRTLRRRFSGRDGQRISEAHSEIFVRCPNAQPPDVKLTDVKPLLEHHERMMRMAISAAAEGSRLGKSKEREPFGAVIVKDGQMIAETTNTVLESRDATATAEVNAIRIACRRLGTHNLEGCSIYCTSHPDLMSLGAILWARISDVYCGVSQQVAAQCGFEEGIYHIKDLIEDRGRKATQVVEAVAMEECESVFKEWSDRNGVIY